MRFAAPLLSLLVLTASARAGIYNTTETEDMKLFPNVFTFWNALGIIRSIGDEKVENDTLLRKRYVFAEALGGVRPPGDLTLEQKLDYSAVLLRRKKWQQAIEFLVPLTRQHSEIFLFDSHLAMAYWGSGQAGNDRRAVEIMSQMLSKRGWPENFADLNAEQRAFFEHSMGWNEGPFSLYRGREMYLLKLMKLRLAEPAGKTYENVDDIFGVKFVNEKGKFEPGKTAAAELKKLPKDAVEIVEQMLLWLPEDLRLYWLLGEIANAQWTVEQLALPDRRSVSAAQYDQAISRQNLAKSNLAATNKIFDDLVYLFKVRATELRDRRQIMHDFLQTVKIDDPTTEGFEAEIQKAIGDDKKDTVTPLTTRTLVITFVTGLAAGIFAVWQFQELRRRRRV